jgi:hypothetical protein
LPDNNETTIKDDEKVVAVHATCMAPMRNLYITLICKSKVMRCLRRSDYRGEGIIKMARIDYVVQLWTGLSLLNTDKLWTVVSTVMNIMDRINCGEFFTDSIIMNR